MNPVNSINKRKSISIVLAALVAFLIIRWVFSLFGSGWLEVTASTDIPSNASVSVVISGDQLAQSVKMDLVPGASQRVKIPKGTVQVEGTAGSLRAIDVVEIKAFKTTKVKTPVGNQKKIQQFGSNVSSCLISLKTGLYSYACGGGTNILKHEVTATHQSINSVLFGGEVFGFLTPLHNGVLTFNGEDSSQLRYVDLSTMTTALVPLPSAISSLKPNNQPLVITSGDPNDTRFALLSQAANKIYLFRDVTDTQPVEVKLGANLAVLDNKHLLRGNLNGSTLTIYAGALIDEGEGEGEGETPAAGGVATDVTTAPKEDGYLFEYDLSGALKKQITLPKDLEADNISKLSGDYYLADLHGVSTFYYYQGKHLEKIFSFEDVGTWITSNGKAYVQADRSLYEFTPGKNGLFGLHSLFTSEDIFVSMLFAGQDGVVFSGFTGKDIQQQLNAYKLGDEELQLGTSQQVEPTYSNFEGFITYGATGDQVDNLKQAIGRYAASTGLQLTSVSVASIVATFHDRANPDAKDIFTFKVSLNKENSLKATAEVIYPNGVHVFLYDKNDTQLFDSGVIDHQNVSL